jgi:hypothetical protein
MAIDTLSNLKLHLNVTGSGDDTRLTALQSAAEAFIESHLNRSFAGGTFVEYHPGGRRVLMLRNYPVTAVTSLKVDATYTFGADTVRPASDYVLHADRGLVEALHGAFLPPRPGFRLVLEDHPRSVQVTYTTAADAAPTDIKRALAELVGHWYRQANTHLALTHTDKLTVTDGTTVTAYPWGVSGGFRSPPHVLALLANYRVPTV